MLEFERTSLERLMASAQSKAPLHPDSLGSTEILQLLALPPRLALQPIHGSERPWFEVLLRPSAVSAEDLVRRAGEIGLASKLDLWVTRAALPRMAAGQSDCYSINVSPLSLAEPGFIEDLLDLTWQCACEPKRLVIEILEAPALSTAQRRNAIISVRVLRTFGMRIALDDVSPGRAHPIPFAEANILKLESSAVKALREPSCGRTREFVSGLTRHGLPVVAEGVEQAADLAQLRALGISLWQGFLGGCPQTWEVS